MFLSLLANWRLWVLLAFAGALGAAWIQTKRLEAEKRDKTALQATFDAFKAQVQAQGEIAQQRADTQAKEDKLRKDKADADHSRTVTLLNQRVSSLRYDREHSGSYGVPTSSPVARSPDRSCFISAEFERAISGFVEGAAGLVAQGDDCRVALDTAKAWAQSR